MKKLKKLSLKKEAIINLNDSEMKHLQGGYAITSSKPCQYIVETILTYTIENTIDQVYDYFMKSKNVDVYQYGWQSKEYFEGSCCISEIEVVC